MLVHMLVHYNLFIMYKFIESHYSASSRDLLDPDKLESTQKKTSRDTLKHF